MKRWNIRVVIYKRDRRFEAECLEAAAAGVGDSPMGAMNDLFGALNTMAVLAERNGAALTSTADDEDDALFRRLTSGDVPVDVAAFGELTLSLEPGADVEEARLDRMELVGGPA